MPDSYDVVVGNNHLFIDRGVMEYWLSEGIHGVEVGYRAISGINKTGDIQDDFGVSSAKLAFALSRAELKKVENEREYFQNKSLEAIAQSD